MLDEGEDANTDDDEAIVPCRRWSSHGPGEEGNMPIEWRLDLIIDEQDDDAAVVDMSESLCFQTKRLRMRTGNLRFVLT